MRRMAEDRPAPASFVRKRRKIVAYTELPIVNPDADLTHCREAWTFDERWKCWCLEDVLYTGRATTPRFQRLSIFVPEPYMTAGGRICPEGRMGLFSARTAPVVFGNNAAGYMQMPHTWLGGPRDEAGRYLARGMVYVSCGCRGRESRDKEGRLCGKGAASLVDLKTALRFLRHNSHALPGDMERIISVGWSAGGAMSSLLALTGNHPLYDSLLRENGAFEQERDDVFAAQIYCPIIDLEHADLAYEWQFAGDPENVDSPAGPAGRMDAFHSALSRKLAGRFPAYFNALGLRHPEKGTALTLAESGREGSAYAYLMEKLEDAATLYLQRLREGSLSEQYGVEDYLCGNYTREAPAPRVGTHLMQGHAGPGVDLPEGEDASPSLGEMLCRPPHGVARVVPERPMLTLKGRDKRSWLHWDGRRARIAGLDAYVLSHCRRMKPCTAFDCLDGHSGENQVLGSPERDYTHFSSDVAKALVDLKKDFPDEAGRYARAWAADVDDAELQQRCRLLNPMNFMKDSCFAARHYRIRVGANDADTSFAVSMALAVGLANAHRDVDYAIVWEQPHAQADYPGEVCDWIERLCRI